MSFYSVNRLFESIVGQRRPETSVHLQLFHASHPFHRPFLSFSKTRSKLPGLLNTEIKCHVPIQFLLRRQFLTLYRKCTSPVPFGLCPPPHLRYETPPIIRLKHPGVTRQVPLPEIAWFKMLLTPNICITCISFLFLDRMISPEIKNFV